ncbi:MAG: lamin tail domain-containing protein [Patescibacteria group bacterium]|nr:lamin tail domain-containing protein [Patescibacteria group bacterium]
MIKKLFFLFFFIFIINSFFISTVFSSLKINEIYPAPEKNKYEWIELYNDENNEVNLDGYFLIDLANNKIKILDSSISPFGFTIASPSSSILNNSGDTVYLYACPENKLIDFITYPDGISSSLSFGRILNGSNIWGICQPTEKKDNSFCVQSPTPTINPSITPPFFICPTSAPTPSSYIILTTTPPPSPTLTSSSTSTPTLILTPTPTQTPTITPMPISYENVFISEVMVNPITGEKEWIEIYNDNDFSVFLNNWYLDDWENAGSTPKVFSLEINPKNYGVIELTSSIFNNDGDSVRLLDFEKNQKDSFEYSNSSTGKTWGRVSFESDFFCLQEPTKGIKNNECLETSIAPSYTPSYSALTNLTKTISTPTPLPSKIPPSPRFYLNTTIFPFNNQGQKKLLNQKKLDNNILGITTNNQKQVNFFTKHNKNLINSLLFISFFHSLISFFSIIFKLNLIKTA